MPTQPTLVLVDGFSYLYRAFHALPPLTNSRGEPTGAILGVLNMLTRLDKEHPDAHVVMVFDAPGRTFRDELFESYKAHRPPMPDDLRAQVQPLLDIIKAMGLPLLRIEGVEADDVMGTLARGAAEAGRRVILSTGDKDMAQMVDGLISVENTMSGSSLDRDGVKAKFDVWPEQIVAYLALVGDSSDNIPGIPKWGAKTAAKWLAQYPTLEELIAHAADIKGVVGENLRNNLETLELSRKLATLNTHVELPLRVEDLNPTAPDHAALRTLYSRYELRSLLRALPPAPAPVPTIQIGDTPDLFGPAPGAPAPARATANGTDTDYSTADAADASATDLSAALGEPSVFPPAPARHYTTILDWPTFESWLEQLRAARAFAFDTETTSLDYMNAEIVGVSFCAAPGVAAYVPLKHDYLDAPMQLDRERVLEALRPLLEDPARPKIGQHLKYDAHVLHNHGIRMAGMDFDTMLESYVWNSVATAHNMDAMAARYLGVETIKFEQVAGRGAKQLTFNEVPVERAAEYSAEDADITLRLHETLWPRLHSVPSLQHLYEQIERPLIPVLTRMEENGVLLDNTMLKQQSHEITQQLQELLTKAHAAAGTDFNIESPRQLQQILFETMQIPVVRKTPTGQPSTAEDVLEELALTHELPRLVLDYRQLAKLKSTYTDRLPQQINARTGRVHPSYHQAVAQTGRLSCADPNLQNIPVRSPAGRRIRQAFIAPPGHVLLAADYSQIELRIMAHLSDDEALLAAFAHDRDVHAATAAEIFEVPLDTINADQRRTAKAINFGLIYGMSPFGLAKQLGIDRTAAQHYVARYFARYPGVRHFMDQTREQAKADGYVQTVCGRRLYLPDIRASNRQLQQYSERSAINAPMQGTAADIIKKAMIAVDAWCQQPSSQARLIMQVHDELVLEVATEAVEQASHAVRALMMSALPLKVPLKVDIGTGANWDQAH